MEKDLFNQRKKVLLDIINDRHYVPMKIKELAILLNVAKKDRKSLEEVLQALIKDGKIAVTKKGKYVKAEDKALVGTFIAHEKGFGFVTVEGWDQDVFIPAKDVNGAFHNDTVLFIVKQEATKDRRMEGAILKVLKHGITEVVGTYQKNKSFGFVIPDNRKITSDIFVLSGKSNGAVTGHKVVVKLTDYGGERHKPEGKVVEILGHINDPGVDILSIIKGYELPMEFPKDVMEQVSHLPEEVTDQEKTGRKDLRGLLTVTIDGEDAKDLDDAVTLNETEDGYLELGVHIADVTHYVTEGSALDKEAIRRGTSVYLVDRVIPMLPHALSNGICSLNQGVDRLALSCLMKIDKKGNIVGHEIARSLIRVDQRMSYTGVNAILTDEEAAEKERPELVAMLKKMNELAATLRKHRYQRGAIDFDFPESKIILDENGKPLAIKPYERNQATRLIEDFMLAANETIAEDYFWQEIPFVYRCHEVPAAEKMQTLATFINNFGYSIHLSQDEVHPMEIQKLLEKVSGTEEEAVISRVCLRSMKQARYTTTNSEHFGLAAKYYCHFTSPIRRYPDLQIHRIIKENLKKGMSGKRIAHYQQILPMIAEQSSMTERRAEEAERDTVKSKKVEYMEQFIGEEFDGVISGVTAWGLYVELPNTVEGMVHITNIKGDYFIFDEEKFELVGEHTNKIYRLGQKVRIRVIGADKLQRLVDFELVEPERAEKGAEEVG